MRKKQSESVPSALEPAYTAIVNLTESLCKQYLNSDYATLARYLAAALARKRPSPIIKGKPATWACGILYALGTVNFLFDKTQTPHMRSDELCTAFGVSQSGGANKAKLIRDLLKIYPLDPNWCLPGNVENNPMVWTLQVNGMLVDVRQLPRMFRSFPIKKD
ncbi:MAG: hypothetical protein HKK67_08250 [Chlorobiaceae bacterium]|nr:hypothetical protein [Chlorobiaceae bacterium]